MLDQQNLKGKKIILRVDFNVPMDANLKVTDLTRIQAAVPTIQTLIEKDAKIILISHLGRPLKDMSDDDAFKEKYFMRNIIAAIEKELNQSIFLVTETPGSADFYDKINGLNDGQIALLENIRFQKGEEKGDLDLAESLAKAGDYFINDAFGAAHREHASTATIARFFDAAHKDFGLLMGHEVHNLERLINQPGRPYIAIIGGAKVSDKITILEFLLDRVDKILIGGGMAFTFLAAQGAKVGKSLVELDKIDIARNLLDMAHEKNVEIVLPIDIAAGDHFSNEAKKMIVDASEIPDEWAGYDIGPASVRLFEHKLDQAKTILWNGPMGVFEFEQFASGTLGVAKAIASATSKGAFSVVGGGDSVAAINRMGLDDQISFVSTGGGAMLEMLEGKDLPGISAIKAS